MYEKTDKNEHASGFIESQRWKSSMHAYICLLQTFLCYFSNIQNFKSGMMAALFATTVMVPADRIKCLLQVGIYILHVSPVRDGPLEKWWGGWGKKQKKNPCKQKGFEQKYMHQTCLKCEKTYLKKKHIHSWQHGKKCKHKKFTPPPSLF
jgi:hypothetical protein